LPDVHIPLRQHELQEVTLGPGGNKSLQSLHSGSGRKIQSRIGKSVILSPELSVRQSRRELLESLGRRYKEGGIALQYSIRQSVAERGPGRIFQKKQPEGVVEPGDHRGVLGIAHFVGDHQSHKYRIAGLHELSHSGRGQSEGLDTDITSFVKISHDLMRSGTVLLDEPLPDLLDVGRQAPVTEDRVERLRHAVIPTRIVYDTHALESRPLRIWLRRSAGRKNRVEPF
jgi:hypothetical protein